MWCGVERGPQPKMSDRSDEGRVEDDEVPSSQVDTEPVFSLSVQADQQSSCDTYMSEQSDHDEDGAEVEDDVPKQERSRSPVNSSLEVEADVSTHNTSSHCAQMSEDENAQCVKAQDSAPGGVDTGDNECQRTKRKDRSDDSSLSPAKRVCQDSIKTENKSACEVLFEGAGVKKEVPVFNISSSSEKTVNLEDSQEYSLRMEDTSPPTSHKDEKSKELQENSSWKSHLKEKNGSPSQGSLSQKSSNSWSSHNMNLSWSSHKDMEDKYANLKKDYDNLKKELAHLKGASLSPPEHPKTRDCSADGDDGWRMLTEERFLLGVVQWTIDNHTNKASSAEIKQVSLVEESSHVEKPSRMSITSSTSHKSSSSSGSVGLPGPFPLPGYSRLSMMSSVSCSTNSSNGTRPGWDGPFLKPLVPGARAAVPLTCGLCNNVYPPVERTSISVVNGSPKLFDEGDMQVKRTGARRSRKQSELTTSSETVIEETSSSDAQPQAASTPTPSKPRGRPRKTPKPAVSKPVKSKSPASGSTPVPVPTKHRPKGEAVLARWADGRYYPGWVVGEPNANQSVLVRFCDGKNKLTPVAKVVKTDIILPGSLILAGTDTGHYEEALVVQVSMDGSEPQYKVERDNVTKEVPFSHIALLETQVTDLTLSPSQRSSTSLNFNDLSLENIISHPRKRSARTLAETPQGSPSTPMMKKKKRQMTPEPSTSHGQSGLGGPEEYYVDTDSSTHSNCSVDLRGKEVKPLDIECSPPEVGQESRIKLREYRRNINKSKKKEDEPEYLLKLLGPIPEPGSELFLNCNFLITYTSEVMLSSTCSVGTSSAEDLSSEAKGDNLPPPMWKERLRTQIKNGGGKLYTTLSHIPKEEMANTYLITDKPCNTPLYLQCVVNNIPIYSHSLIKKCCDHNKKFKELIALSNTKKMYAGYSLSKKCLVNPRSLQPLRGKTLLLALSGEQSLTTFWESMIKKMGGLMEIYRGGALIEHRFDVIVTDADCDQDLVMQACEQDVPLVSMTWLLQCLINGELQSPTEHPLYKYNGSFSTDSPDY